MRRRRRRRGGYKVLGPLGRRVAVGSLLIALGSIAVITTVTLFLFDLDLGSAGREQENAYRGAVVSSLKSAYVAREGWRGADFSPARAIVRLEGAGLSLRTSGGRVITLVPGSGGSPVALPIVVEEKKVATAIITGPPSGLSPTDLSIRHNLVNGLLIAAVPAAVLALSAAVVASRRLVAPLRALTEAASSLGSGNRSVRVGELRAPGELGQLAKAFDDMAGDLEHEDELRRSLVADLAHELRTPVAILRAQLTAVSEGIAEPSTTTMASLTEEVDRLGRLVGDLGVLAEAQAARLEMRRVPVDLAEVARTAAERLSVRFSEEGVRLAMELQEVTVLGDTGRLEQVAVNLLSNAEKFSGPGGEVRLSVARSAGAALLTVSDDGPGIPPAERERVFERFFQGTASRSSAGGSGVGLAVVSEIVSAHGGWVSLESEQGRGASFTVVLPLPS